MAPVRKTRDRLRPCGPSLLTPSGQPGEPSALPRHYCEGGRWRSCNEIGEKTPSARWYNNVLPVFDRVGGGRARGCSNNRVEFGTIALCSPSPTINTHPHRELPVYCNSSSAPARCAHSARRALFSNNPSQLQSRCLNNRKLSPSPHHHRHLHHQPHLRRPRPTAPAGKTWATRSQPTPRGYIWQERCPCRATAAAIRLTRTRTPS